MKTCKTCKWWRRGGCMAHKDGMFGDRPDQQGEEMGIILESTGRMVVCMTDQESKTGICLHQKMTCDAIEGWLNRSTPEQIVDGVKCTCDEERGWLEVGQDFGCIHHKQIES